MGYNVNKEYLKTGFVIWLAVVAIAAFCGTIFGSFVTSF